MSVNNNHPPKNSASSSPFRHSIPSNPTAHLQSQTQSQMQQPPGSSSPFPNQFHLSQYAAAHAHSQAMAQTQANHAQFQAHGVPVKQSHTPSPTNSPSFPSTNTTTKRMPQKPTGRPSNPTTISPMKTTELTPTSRNKKRQKLSGKNSQEKIASILPQSALYTQLLEFESRIDAAIVRKKIDIQEAIKNPPCIQKTLRIYVFNTSSPQNNKTPKKPNTDPPTWTMKIIGRILEDGMDPEQAGLISKPNPIYPKFSSFFKRVTISLDQRLYPDNHTIVWENSRTSTHEGFEVKRKGDKEFVASIRLEMNYLPEKYKLSSPLTEILGIEVDTRSRIVAAIWQYIKARKLQIKDNPSYFNCDLPLQKIFGEEKMKFSMVSQKIIGHLSPPQPIHLEHKIKFSGNSPAGNACYDVVVDVPFLVQKELNGLLVNIEKSKEIERCNESICDVIRKINERRKRRAFFVGFSESPVEFIDALIESQGRDLRLLAGEGSCGGEKENRADFYTQPWVEDAVIRYLNRKPATKVNEGHF